jgi:hypothetical protein
LSGIRVYSLSDGEKEIIKYGTPEGVKNGTGAVSFAITMGILPNTSWQDTQSL